MVKRGYMKIKILCIMLSKTADSQIRQMTDQALVTMYVNAGNNIELKCVLVETENNSSPYAKEYVDTFYPKENEFAYNRFLNLGYNRAKLFWPEFFAENNQENCYVVLTNNDIYFHENWAENLASAINVNNLDSVSPLSRGWQFHKDYHTGIYEGFGIGFAFTGWNQMYKRSSFEMLYPLDESFCFWASDNSIALEMQKLNMKHALVVDSQITHFTSASHRLIPHGKHHEWTQGQCDILNKKIGEGKYIKDA